MGVRVDMPDSADDMVQEVKEAAHEAAAHPWVEVLLRLGFVVRGLLYGVVGGLAFKVAIGGGGDFKDTQGAIATVAQTQWGGILLWVILAGLIGYGLLGLIRAFLDPLRKGKDLKGIIDRAGYAASGISYLALGGAAFNLMRGVGEAAENGAQGERLRESAGTLLATSWGPWLVGLAGAVIVGAGVVQIVKATSKDFGKQFQAFELSASQRKWIDRIGRFGGVARGVVFGLVGAFLMAAAYYHDPDRAQGIDGVLATLLQQKYGPVWLGIIALGLIAFAIYSALSAVWLRLPKAGGVGANAKGS